MAAPAPSIGYVTLRCRCPACGKSKLYRSLLMVVVACEHCGLALAKHDQGDGPAFFAIILVGALSGILAAIFDIRVTPPFWVHVGIWIPFILIGLVLAIRTFKAALIAAHYRYRPDDFVT